MLDTSVRTACAVVGGGPAGMVLGLLLARAGVDVTVLEKHADFFRDFRGDTIHPSTLEVMYELGFLDEFLQLPHVEQRQFQLQLQNELVPGPDFTTLPTRCKFMVLMPQWDFLNFLAAKAKRYPNFRLLMETEATDVIREGERVVGVRATSAQGPLDIRCDLVVGTDGRHSKMRDCGGFVPIELGAPMDVLWMRISRRESDGDQIFGTLTVGKFMVMLNRGDYWQCAYIIKKGTFEEIKARGLAAFGTDIATVVPYLRDRVGELRSWDDVKLLTVAVNRLPHWSEDGLLCIGDAAHAMSPIGGVGINLAVADAVAAANLLWRPLRERCVTEQDLKAVQRRREAPVKKMQSFQVTVQNRLVSPTLEGKLPQAMYLMRFVLRSFRFFRVQMARVAGLAFQPEHVESPELPAVPARV